jgi:hypothetical protein
MYMDWHLYHNGEKSGPLSEAELFKMGREGRLSPADLVWNQSMIDWTPADQISGLIGTAPHHPAGNPAVTGSEKENILQEILHYSEAGPFIISRGSDTDLVITNEVTNSTWYSGKKTVAYTARMLLNEKEKTAYYWEMLKETSAGLSFSVGFQKKKMKGIELFQQSREKGYSPGGEIVYDYQFEYGSLRNAFKQLLQSHGWKLKVVVMKGKTTY